MACIALTRCLRSRCRIAFTTQVLEFSFCTVEGAFKIPIFSTVVTVLQLILAAVMCISVVVQFSRESLHMYKATGRWRLGCYMNLFVREGVIYFLLYVHTSWHLSSRPQPDGDFL